MGFNTSPKPSPTIVQPTGARTAAETDKRERAIAALMGNKTEQAQPKSDLPVRNATQVSPEEMSIVQPKQSLSRPIEEPSEQTHSNEGTQPAEKPSTEAKTSTEDPSLSSKFAVLARKEKAFRAKVQAQQAAEKSKEDALKAREEALKAKESEYQNNYIQKDRLSTDPWTVLQEMGIGYDQITQLALNTPNQDPATKLALQKLEAQLEAERKAREDDRKANQEASQRQYQQALNQIKRDTISLVKSNPDFETIKETGSEGDVVDLIEKTYKEDGILLTVDEACKEVEDYLVEEATRLARIKKIQARLSPAKDVAPKAPESKSIDQALANQKDSERPVTKTLTNQMSTTKRLSARERAIAIMEGRKLN
jgi:hypothetical protein